MKTTELNKLADGTLVFCTYTTLHFKSGSASKSHEGETYGYSGFFTTPEEFFAYYPDATYCDICRMEGGELIHGCGTFNKSGYANDWALRGHEAQLGAQRFAAEADGSVNIARAKVEAVKLAQTLPVMTAETHEPVTGENFRRWSKRDLPAIVQAKRRAVELGCSAVILHNLPGEKYGMRWSPAQPKK